MCIVTTSISPFCATSLGGLKKIWIARREDANTYAYDIVGFRADDSDHVIQSVTNNGAAVMWSEWHVEDTIDSLIESMERSSEGTNFIQEIPLYFPNLDIIKRQALKQLIYDRVVLVVQDRMGNYWLAGQKFGMRVISYSAETGTVGQGQGYSVTLQAEDTDQFRLIDDDFLSNVAVNNGPQSRLSSVVEKSIGGSGPNGTVTSVLSTWTMPLYQFGNQPIKDVIT